MPAPLLPALLVLLLQLLFEARALSLVPNRAPQGDRIADKQPFDKKLATALAGYAFDVYNDLPVGKASQGSDGTIVRFTSTNYVGRIFSGVLMVTLRRGELNAVRGGEDSLLERAISGDKADPYAELSCIEDSSAARPWRRAVDSAISSVKPSTTRPVWNETLFLYVSDPLRAQLEVRVMDKDTFKEDDFIGRAVVPLASLAQGQASTALPLPLYIDDPNDPRSAAAQNTTDDSTLLGGIRRFFVSSRPRRMRTGTLFADLQYIAFNASSAIKAVSQPQRLPVGATLGLNWARLIQPTVPAEQTPTSNPTPNPTPAALSQQRLLTKGLERVCSLENYATDTQAGVWADRKSRSILVSFRGTETVKFRDILTDINLFQCPFLDAEPSLRKAMVHTGFLAAYRSVAPAIAQLLERLLLLPVEPGYAEEGSGWTLYITGHSLGGALATFLAFDLFRAAEGLLAPSGGSGSFPDPYHRCGESEVFSKQLQLLNVHLCTFGAPRVGCPEFKTLFERLQKGPCYRVVNSDDIVARIPRGASLNRLLSYEHVGRTVMIDGNRDGSDGGRGQCWVEGESEGLCPLADYSPFGVSVEPSQSPSSGVASALQLLGVGEDGAKQLLAAYTFASDVSRGLEASFLQREAAIARSLVDGKALESHLEPAYFAAFERLLNRAEAV